MRNEGWVDKVSRHNYAVVDCARSPLWMPTLTRRGGQMISLFRGKSARELAAVAPYLLELREARLAHHIVDRLWGCAWGILLQATCGAEALRLHLRKFLMVRLPDASLNYFRFYDPRVLRTFLPGCDPDQITQIFGPIDTITVEDTQRGAGLQFTHQRGVLKLRTLTRAELEHEFAQADPE
jgi:hypothetical protein